MYYIYEMQIPEEDLQLLKFIAEKERMSLNDFFVRGFAYINCSYFGGIISYFYYPGKTPGELTLTTIPRDMR